MSNKHSRVRGAAAPPGADDFQVIDGIGPGIERRLYDANILTYAQLASLSPDEIAPLVAGIAGLSVERIVKQDWVGQARALAPERALGTQQLNAITQLLPDLQEEALSHRPYATFTVELLLDDDNRVRRTRANHVQGSTEDSWAGWHASRLVDFFIRQGALNVAGDEQASKAAAPEELRATAEVDLVSPVQTSAAAELAAPQSPDAQLSNVLAGTLAVRELGLSTWGARLPSRMLRAGQPFSIELALDLANVSAPPNVSLAYSATMFAKKMASKERLMLGEAQGTLPPRDTATIAIACADLTRGIYRVEVAVTLRPPDGAPAAAISSYIEGGLLQIF
jgi:hypothetical protein